MLDRIHDFQGIKEIGIFQNSALAPNFESAMLLIHIPDITFHINMLLIPMTRIYNMDFIMFEH